MTTKPVHRQFGSKARVAPAIVDLIPHDTRIWAEAFAGTGAVTLAKHAHPEEHINDLNGEIIGLFRVIRDPAMRARLCDLVDATPWAEAEWRAAWEEPCTGDPVEDARRFLVRSWQVMGGAIRAGTGWIAFDGASKSRPRIWDDLHERIQCAATRLKTVAIHQKPALQFVARVGAFPKACILVDPPYPIETLADPRSRYAVDMTPADHEEMIGALLTMRCRVILTMTPNTVYDRLADAGWWRTEMPVRGMRNSVKTELIWTNFKPPEIQQLSLLSSDASEAEEAIAR